MRDFLCDASAPKKRPIWIPEMFWEQMMKDKRGGGGGDGGEGGGEGEGAGKHTGGSISVREHQLKMIRTNQADLSERFSKSRHLEELHKHQSRDKKGQYPRFHEARQITEEEAAATGAVARLPPYCLEAEQRIMKWVKAIVSSVCAAFDEHMRRFAE
ncbi:hypothetical protein M9H77_22589 [Catharanthus roseus]|uniref:Uncharacterized protein n=1 Tax=Catharanthus roseus TaxID=4058 RepID=A0ACC0ARA9_CATRO|nr:hypothetical protein M9H77_22589 [Catharanthus roseus]